MTGSVSGGCVEGAVVKESRNVIFQRQGKRLSYGVTDYEAWSVGLTCGGKIQVYLQAFPPAESDAGAPWSALLKSLKENKSGVLITALNDGVSRDTFVSMDGKATGATVPEELLRLANDSFQKRVHQSPVVDGTQYFLHVFPRRSQLLIVGAAHITADLVQLAYLHDFETIVIDPRGAFADYTKFTQAPDVILVKYPSEVLNDLPLDAYTYAVILSHDPKIDDDAIRLLLRTPVAYIGALGSRKTHEKRVARLVASGFTEEEIKRIESPVGVDIHALGAKEIALSIMASVIRTKNQYL